uniref:Uncharacterized protein n=1 Tax=Ananas comosus var. bracteatus TaxID=296719 RepID=A0A6V7QBX7_ANACO|nr:unnamed protein product [Ananas comosus var. bracteatus]
MLLQSYLLDPWYDEKDFEWNYILLWRLFVHEPASDLQTSQFTDILDHISSICTNIVRGSNYLLELMNLKLEFLYCDYQDERDLKTHTLMMGHILNEHQTKAITSIGTVKGRNSVHLD